MAKNNHKIVVAGGNMGGVQISHYLLRKTIPSLHTLDPNTDYHLTLISPNTHFFFKIASPRALINATLIPTDKIFKPLAAAFQQYGARFNHVQGKAVDMDVDTQEVLTSSSTGSYIRIKYDSLVIATGASTTSPLWSMNTTHEHTIAALRTLHSELPQAKTIVIAGGGPVGIETAGEVASAYPDAKVTLIGGKGGLLLPREKARLGMKAEDMLESLGVDVKLGLKLADANASSTTRPIPLSNGTSLSPSVFINATGPRTYNTSWLPPQWLNDDGQVLVSDAYFRVRSTSPSTNNVYVIGDAAAGYRRTAIELDAMVPTASSSIAIDIIAQRGLKVMKARSSSLSSSSSFTKDLVKSVIPSKKINVGEQIEFKPVKDTIVVSIGPKGGVGMMNGWALPNLMVKKGKAERFLLELVEPLVDGSKFD
ncbi:FAD/NAD(P)-binding domain-containing protein [Periconia macrospinosa]|uniref:FAD/NAD(P)-binding domain-containing protein n=1 Tax=Periconia macrospinosa TaxID=97972 RepID=A0A2V1DF77_9PLEO|nr:FAD/NAD(P)-binding domain-containing protein [Periconia macrospinosa]